MSKILVAYFSASGVTKKAAQRLAKVAGTDLFEIRPAIPYTSADLNWMDKKSRSSVEMNDSTSRPEIAEQVTNMSDYDTVFIGFPIWWYGMPMVMYSFFDEYDFSGKTIIPFCTSGGSAFSDAISEIKNMEPDATVLDGLHIGGSSVNDAESRVNEWVSELGLSK